jgi:hypothetical protein
MALLSQMIRYSAITGRPEDVHAWFADRQGGRWADQMVRSAMPARAHVMPQKPIDPTKALRDMTELHQRGLLSDQEFAALRARLRV